MSHARKNILAAFNDLSKNKIGARPYVFSDSQLDAMIFDKYGSDPGQHGAILGVKIVVEQSDMYICVTLFIHRILVTNLHPYTPIPKHH